MNCLQFTKYIFEFIKIKLPNMEYYTAQAHNAGLSFETPLDRFSRVPQIFLKFLQGFSATFL